METHMDFELKIIEAARSSKFAAAIENNRTWGRCTQVNPELVDTLNRNGIETILVETRFPKGAAAASHFYALARDKKSGEVKLVDGVVSSRFGLGHPFVGTIAEAQGQIGALGKEGPAHWDFESIVISKVKVPAGQREAFRKKWGEFGDHLVFDVPQKGFTGGDGSIFDENLRPSGHVMSLDEMNRYAAGRNFSFNLMPPVVPEIEVAHDIPQPVQVAVANNGAPTDDPKVAEATHKGHWFTRLTSRITPNHGAKRQ